MMPPVYGLGFAEKYSSELNNQEDEMATTKLMDNNRRTHAAKILTNTGKRNNDEVETSQNDKLLDEQVRLIRKDFYKLRDDLAEGYGLLKNKIVNRFSIRAFLKEK